MSNEASAIDPSPREPWLPTAADHEAGFKELRVEYRSGKTESLRLAAPPTREVRAAARVLLEGGDFHAAIVSMCLPAGRPAGWLDRLTIQCVAQIEAVALELALGKGTVEKMQAAMRRAAAATPAGAEAEPGEAAAPVVIAAPVETEPEREPAPAY